MYSTKHVHCVAREPVSTGLNGHYNHNMFHLHAKDDVKYNYGTVNAKH